MKKHFIVGMLLYQILNCNAQDFRWSAQRHFDNPTGGTGIVHDHFGRIYVTGEYEPVTRSSNITTGGFLSVYDTAGTLMWTINSSAKHARLAITPSNELLISAQDSTGYFISKYDSSSTLINRFNVLPQSTHISRSMIRGIGTDASGNFYIAGLFCDTITLGSFSAISPPRVYSVFLAKYNSSGTCQWLETGSRNADILAFTVDAAGNSYFGGEYLISFSIGSTTLSSSAFSAGYVAKFSTGGTLQWLYEIDGDQQQYVISLATDNSGNIYAAGYFDKKLDAGPDNSSNPNQDIFLLKLNSSGVLDWVREMGGSLNDELKCLFVTGAGNIYLGGSFETSCDFGNSISLSSSSSERIEPFIAKYSSSGSSVWALSGNCSGGSMAYCASLSVDSDENIAVTGSFIGTVGFGSHTQENANVSMFVAKIRN